MDDVIIVGAGPGGGSAGYRLGQAGLRVRLFEKEVIPRYKTCGGGLSRAMLAHYFPFSFDSIIESQAESIRYTYQSDSVTISLPENSLVFVMRDRFDAYLLEHARIMLHQGQAIQKVEEKEDCVEVITREGRRYAARFLIGADGANSTVARYVRRRQPTRPAAGIEAEISVPASIYNIYSREPLFILGENGYGYAWVFPKSTHLSVGIAALQPKPGELQNKLRQIMGGYGIELDMASCRGHPIPIYCGPRRMATRRILLVGDAAGLADPLSGEGIRMAIKSGRLAADAIIHNPIRAYQPTVFRKISFSHTLALPLAGLFYILPEPCYALGVCNPYASRAFIDMLADKTQYFEVLLRLFGALPIFVVQESFRLVDLLFKERHKL